jgi:hypothetical protein
LLHPINNRIAGKPPLKSGANRGWSVPLEQLVPYYWAGMGWDEKTGQPLDEDLQTICLSGLES